MRPPSGGVLPVFFAVIFVGAMVLGPLLYFVLGPIWPVPFHRAMDRALMICAVAALALFASRIPLREWWPPGRRAWVQLAFGYGLAFVSAQAMLGLDLACCGFTSSHLGASQVGARIGLALVAALLVPPLEETIFRGFLLSELARSMGRVRGCVIAAAIFMLAHFLKVPESLDHQPVHFWSGVSAIGNAFLPVIGGAFLSAHGLNLFLIGLILGGIFLVAGSLWINAGLHSGWILALLLFSGLTRPTVPPRIPLLASGDLLSSPLTTLVLILLAVWLWRYYPPRSDPSEAGASAP
jgi:membrane protease YdiL (CAAX protease family)